jgi:hypothetical protein
VTKSDPGIKGKESSVPSKHFPQTPAQIRRPFSSFAEDEARTSLLLALLVAAQVSDAAGRVCRGIADDDKLLCVGFDFFRAPATDLYLGHDSLLSASRHPMIGRPSIPFGALSITGSMPAEKMHPKRAKDRQFILLYANLNQQS